MVLNVLGHCHNKVIGFLLAIFLGFFPESSHVNALTRLYRIFD